MFSAVIITLCVCLHTHAVVSRMEEWTGGTELQVTIYLLILLVVLQCHTLAAIVFQVVASGDLSQSKFHMFNFVLQ